MALRELVTQLRYELKDGNLKKYVDGYRNAEKQINTVAKAASQKLNGALRDSTRSMGEMNRTGGRLTGMMRGLVRETREFAIGLRQGARQGYGEVLRQMDRVEARQRRLRRAGAGGAGERMGFGGGMLQGAIQGVLATVSGKAIMDASDEWSGARSRIGLQTGDSRTRDRSSQFLFQSAQNTGQSYSSLADTFVSLARGRESLGITNDQTLLLSNTLSKLLTIGGGSQGSQDAALTQFGQAMNSGVLRGDELNSVIEQAPRLAQAIAESLGTSVGNLKKLGEEGKITSKAIADGLLRQTQKVDEEFAKLPMTFSRSWTQIRNNFVKRAGEINDQYKLAEKFNTVAQWVIKNMAAIGGAMAAIAGSWVVVKIFTALSTVFKSLQAVGRPLLLFFDRLARGNIAQAFSKFGPAGLRVLKVLRAMGASISAIGVLGGIAFAALVAAVAVVAALIYKYWEPIKAFFGGLWDGLKSGGTQAFNELLAAFAPLGPAFETIGGWLQGIWDWFMKLLAPVESTSEELNTAAEYGKAFGEIMMLNVRMVIAGIGLVVDAIVWLGEAIGTALGWIVVTADNTWEGLKSGVSRLWDWITGIFRTGWETVSGMAPDWLKAGFKASIPSGMRPDSWNNIGAGAMTSAGRSSVNQTVTQTASVSVMAPPGGNPASYGAAAQRGTSKALSSFQYQLPTAVEAF
ncbi:tape measure protein [Stenotrophomonas bentonitica]|uniref:tape measure protein n=1 Tax=Stenotrophomonas bentonitica TaxID=1450134 RepID=UPI0037D84E01